MSIQIRELAIAPAASPWKAGLIVRLALVAALLVGGALAAEQALPGADVPAPQIATVDGLPMTEDGVVVPSEPVDGLLSITIPPGTADLQAEGKPGYVMPSVIRVKVGDTIRITNNDQAAHIMLYGFLPAGATDVRTFDTPGSEVYSSGCSPSAADFNAFTTILISA
jgi:hypothetical protein